MTTPPTTPPMHVRTVADYELAGDGYYYLRAVPTEVLSRARARAAAEGRTLKWVLVHALRAYGEGEWSPLPWASTSAVRGRARRR